jgi:Single-strand binding protein family
MNLVVLTGRLTRDPETRALASGKTVTQFSVATNDYRGGSEKSQYHPIVTCVWCTVRRTSPPTPRPIGLSCEGRQVDGRTEFGSADRPLTNAHPRHW